MKIQLASTLPFSPVQLDDRYSSPRRSVGQLQVVDNGTEYRLPVYQFRHDNNGAVQYQVHFGERAVVEDKNSSTAAQPDSACGIELEWLDHNEGMTYKPYAFLVMDAMTRLANQWDGVVYRTPSGERLRESAFKATLQIIDACVSPRDGLWVMVSLSGDQSACASLSTKALRQVGWVPVAC